MVSERTKSEIINQYKYNGSQPKEIAHRLGLDVETVTSVIDADRNREFVMHRCVSLNKLYHRIACDMQLSDVKSIDVSIETLQSVNPALVTSESIWWILVILSNMCLDKTHRTYKLHRDDVLSLDYPDVFGQAVVDTVIESIK